MSGLRSALGSLNELAGVYPVDAEPESIPEDERSGESAPIALVTGSSQGLLAAHRVGNHGRHWLFLAPNSEGVPRGFKEGLLKTSEVLPRGLLSGGILTPSEWAARVLREEFPEKTVIVVPHGVRPGVHKVLPAEREHTRNDYAHGLFNVLHMTSTEADRKGTRPLLRAFREAKDAGELPKTAKLHVVMTPIGLSKLRFWAAQCRLTDADLVVAPGFVHTPIGIAALYAAMHVVCQPSRAEGFGLVPLEALACGVPVVATRCTGHAEYATLSLPGFYGVSVGPSEPMDDFPGSRAPSVSVRAIRNALEDAYTGWLRAAEDAERNAPALAEAWAWEKASSPGLRKMLDAKGDR